MIRYSKLHAWLCLFLVFLMTFVQPLAVFADVNNSPFAVNPDYLICTGSNADLYGLMTLELGDDDYGVAPASSIQSVTNTIDFSDAAFWVYQMDLASEKAESFSIPLDSNGFARYDVPSGKSVLRAGIRFGKNSLPPSGTYDLQISYSSDFSYSYNRFQFWSRKKIDNASVLDDYFTATSLSQQLSGDVYFNMVIGLNSITNATYYWYYDKAVSSGKTIAGYFDVNFSKSSDQPDYTTVGSGMTDANYNEGMTDAVGNISSSIGDMSSSMDSAAESLEYISTSQNLIIQGIDNVIMHISDQLYAFWDQLYNLIHEPTYARLEQILLALKAIANNSDISAVVDTIEETTQQQIANDNANTGKVESAVEKHGNFIIEGLKSLFIPSDEYFKSYFDDLYAYFSDRFGFLSFPIDLLVRLIDLFVNAADEDCILTLPDFEISGQPLISEASFNLTEFLERDFAILLSSIRLVTSIGLIIAFVHLCQDKWNEVMRN